MSSCQWIHFISFARTSAQRQSVCTGLKTVIETLPPKSTDIKVIIKVDRKPSHEHRGHFNAPHSEVAVFN